MAIQLINNTKSVSKIGYLVSLDPSNSGAFVYTTPNSSRAIGVVVDAVEYRKPCKIATIGDKCKVYVAGNTVKDSIIRGAKSGDNISLGANAAVKPTDTNYLKIGTALESGSGLVSVVLELTYLGSASIQTGIVNVTSTSYTVGAIDSLVVVDSLVAVDIYIPSATGAGRVIKIGNVNTGLVTVHASGSDTINGETTQDIYEDSCMDIQDYKLNNWIIV